MLCGSARFILYNKDLIILASPPARNAKNESRGSKEPCTRKGTVAYSLLCSTLGCCLSGSRVLPSRVLPACNPDSILIICSYHPPPLSLPFARANEHNIDSLMLAALPYHGTNEFVRLLQVICHGSDVIFCSC